MPQPPLDLSGALLCFFASLTVQDNLSYGIMSVIRGVTLSSYPVVLL